MSCPGAPSNLSSVNCSSHYDMLRGNPEFQALRLSSCIVYVYMGIPLIVAGLAGNVLSLITLRKDSPTTTTFLLQALAFADTVYLLVSSFTYVYNGANVCFYLRETGRNKVYVILQPYTFYLVRVAQTIGNWIVVTVAFDRYMKICFFLKAIRMCTVSRIKKVVMFISLFAALAFIPMLFQVKLGVHYDPCTGAPYPTQVFASWYFNRAYLIGYITVFQSLFRAVIPLLLLAFLNARMVLYLHRAKRVHRSITARSSQNREIGTTLLLVSVVTVFLVCQLPYICYLIVSTISRFAPHVLRLPPIEGAHFVIALNLMLVLNASTNFIIYLVVGSRFRSLFLKIFCARGKHDHEADMQLSHRSSIVTTISNFG